MGCIPSKIKPSAENHKNNTDDEFDDYLENLDKCNATCNTCDNFSKSSTDNIDVKFKDLLKSLEKSLVSCTKRYYFSNLCSKNASNQIETRDVINSKEFAEAGNFQIVVKFMM